MKVQVILQDLDTLRDSGGRDEDPVANFFLARLDVAAEHPALHRPGPGPGPGRMGGMSGG